MIYRVPHVEGLISSQLTRNLEVLSSTTFFLQKRMWEKGLCQNKYREFITLCKSQEKQRVFSEVFHYSFTIIHYYFTIVK